MTKTKTKTKTKTPTKTPTIVRSLSVGNGTTYQLRMVDCGKDRCRKGCAVGKPSHGPYWYAVTWNPATGGTKAVYHGKNEPSISDIADEMTGGKHA